MAQEALTPMMKQFHDMKATNPDAILLFRCGDFYETYSDDAVVASQILGITLTKRNQKGSSGSIAMAGFPHHALDNYLPRLIRAGHRVAICDQLEDPKLTKKLVKRGITELVTPGVALGDNVLASKENNFLAAIHFGAASVGLSLLDISTGEYLVAEGDVEYIDKLLAGFSPKEILVERGLKGKFDNLFAGKYFVFELDDWAFADVSARTKVLKHFDVKNLKGFGIDHLHAAITAAGAILTYLEQTQHHHTDHITRITRIEEERFVRLDKFTIRNLELVSTNHGDGRSLLQVLDRTLTPMGARQLRRWVLFPLRSVKDINTRLDSVEQFFRQPEFRELCEMELGKVGDLERIVSKVATGRINPREMQQLRAALETVMVLKNVCLASPQESIRAIGEKLAPCTELRQRIERELRLDPPLLVNKGGVINEGVDAQLDELRNIQTSGKDYLLQIQEREIARTGIQSLKIGFNNVFGYYMEVRNTYKEFVPEEWIRKQTLVNAERYITQELKEYEEKILGAEDKILILETRLYGQLVAAAAECIVALQHNAQALSDLDCYHSLAHLARTQKYVRPVVGDTTTLDIKAGRHPVIETLMPVGEEYIANDILLDTESQQIIIVTGPNMAGKSALLRQTALITLLAQMGSFVPADSARVGLVDKIFTRVGASDNISVGESTFMVEMSEAANIMNNLTERSLVLFDELGRGTSTYDGISIAWSIVEHIHENPTAHARTLFATHYHELNEMENRFARIKNYNVSVREVDHRIVFLRKLARGGSEHSFGIHVARLAGMPSNIVRRAESILHHLEANRADDRENVGATSDVTTETLNVAAPNTQLSFFQLDDPVLTAVRDEILHLDINNLTPMEALNRLHEIRKILTGQA
ncbi:DNA mismatch repair protein MutS [Alloprevotella sp. oral taxon 473]|uniref:DNA mismatch repair protein MutS n=1 Tax=Alloprevotella sp. oral taxon 473 TaxID=712469 RepID=UPI0002A1DF94|nr:DNA mismatch repair protein MutS [Alloprevotella sp. oral taxon 473]EKX91073.1 DNA mismatch repair protein MutS [Alloprevotella sp. oral taxon 473 str. F0040]